MLKPPDIRERLLRAKYPAFLDWTLAGNLDPFFPVEINFGRPKPSDPLPEVDAGLRALAEGSAASIGYGYTLETAKRQTRINEQTYPTRVYFPDERNFLRFIGKEREVTTLRYLVAETNRVTPEISGWVQGHPTRLLQVADRWADLLKVLRYLCDRPRPGCFPRELPLDVSGKLLGENIRLVREILDTVPGVTLASGEDEARLGLLAKPKLVSVRFLTERCAGQCGSAFELVTVRLSDLMQRPFPVPYVFIVENEMTFLTFPAVSNALVVWGRGNAASEIAPLSWLAERTLYYLGDIDAWGFKILGDLRAFFPNVASLLMDQATLDYARAANFVTTGAELPSEHLRNLTPAELELASSVAQQHIQVEQEKLPRSLLSNALVLMGLTPVLP
ncbi:MAG: DUF2220 family protein [Opitutaceae bacterium]|nr:DUF2220 family protein [Opitutaceae bacterium]